MGLRGLIKDILFIYLGFMVIRLWFTGGKITASMVVVTIVIFFLIGWFMLERVGILEHD
ncbi:MAG: hypothetical protein QW404_02335 [Candidatus Nanoarchaeia archaeon]